MTQRNVHIPQRAVVDNLFGCARDIYQFDLHGGEIGTFLFPVVIPANAIITECMVDVLEAPTSAGAATISLGLATADDLLVATPITGVAGVVVAKTQADAFKIPNEVRLQLNIGAAALTAGKFAVSIKWIGSHDDIVNR